MAIVHTNRVDLQGYPVTFEIRVRVDTETFVSEKESFSDTEASGLVWMRP